MPDLAFTSLRAAHLGGVDGEFRRGRVSAILGPSGAGKTTLLSVLAGRVPRTGGAITLDGEPADLRELRQLLGFATEEDALLPLLTTEETLDFAAAARLPSSVTRADRAVLVDRILHVLGLTHIRRARVGSGTASDARGISFGERRRLSIGVELVVMPEVLFVDDATCGLDSRTAREVVWTLSRVATAGLTVAAILHQPSWRILERVDDVLCLARGGRTAFCGPADEALAYFDGLGFACPPGESPAAYLISLLGGTPSLPADEAARAAGPAAAAAAAALAPPTPPPAVDVALERAAEAVYADLLSKVLRDELPKVVKLSVRGAVAALLPARRRRPHSQVVWNEVLSALLGEVIHEEAAAAVTGALRSVARGYTNERSAERVYERALSEVLAQQLPHIARDAAEEAAAESLIEQAMAPLLREVTNTSIREARGAVARQRDGAERAAATSEAADSLVEHMLLERLLQQVSTRAEPLLLERHASSILDEILAEGLSRRALALTARQHEVRSSALLGPVHAEVVYAAMADELLAQLAALSASGHEDADAVWPSESDDDDDDASLNASFREPAAGSEGDSDE